MIGPQELERAERTLQVVYGGDISRALEALKVDREAWDSLIEQNWSLLKGRYHDSLKNLDPRIEPAFNTIMTHCLFVGIIAGRNTTGSPIE